MKAYKGHRAYYRWILVACCALLPLLAGVEFKRRLSRVPIIANDKLCDVIEREARGKFVAPLVSVSLLVIGVQSPAAEVRLAGRVCVCQRRRVVYERVFGPENLRPSNWLNEFGLQAYIIGWNDTSNRLKDVLQPGKVYEVRVMLDERPETPVSLWLSSVQPRGAYLKTKRPIIVEEKEAGEQPAQAVESDDVGGV